MIRVAVTASADAIERTCAQILLAELEPVILPCIEIQEAPEPILANLREEAAGADLLLFTSARAVQVVWPGGGMPSVPAVVVGAHTGRAVEAAGGVVELAGNGGGDEIVDRLLQRVVGRKVVFPHSGSARSDRTERLREAGADVFSVAAYETIPIAPDPDPVEAAVFASPSAVEGWTLSRSLLELDRVAAIGPATESELTHRGRAPDVVPARPSIAALVTQLSLSLERT